MDDIYTVCPYCGAATDIDAAAEQPEEQQNANPNPQPNQQQYNMPPYGQPNFNPQYNQQYNASYQQRSAYPPEYTPAPRPQRSAYIAAILAILPLGAFGVHNFYLDRKNKALAQLLISVIGMVITLGLSVVAMEIYAIVEGVKILKGEINTDGNGNLIKMGF